MAEETQAQRIARLKRTEMLEAALAEVVEVGWRGMQVQAVAKRVGVSRQTVYNTFNGRDGLASALIEHLTHSFLDGFHAAFASGEDASEQWEAAIFYLLRRGLDDPALRALLGVDNGDQFLGLLTSGSRPIVTIARQRMRQTAEHFQPGLNGSQVEEAAEIITRLTLSNIVQEMESIERLARSIAKMVTAFLGVKGSVRPTSAVNFLSA